MLAHNRKRELQRRHFNLLLRLEMKKKLGIYLENKKNNEKELKLYL